MNYMKQLDALRALAVFGVLYQHFVNGNIFHHSINLGAIGVDLFYVLSGFLITGILLKSKNEIDNRNTTILISIKKFFISRTLRIFPIFYLTLFVAFILNITPVRETLWWHVCYASNYYFAQRGSWHGPITHLWSLAVEEQFYLIWPWIILLVPKKQLLGVLIFVIALSPIFRHICSFLNVNRLVAVVVTLGNMDLFGIGALLAYLRAYNFIQTEKAQIYLKLCFAIGGFLFFESLLLKSFGLVNSLDIFARTFEGFFFCWAINNASAGYKGAIGSILEFKPFLYLGKISYGIYLYHNFVPSVTPNILNILHIPVPNSVSTLIIIYTILTLTIASISWYLIEKPISIFKNKFQTSHITKQNPVSLVARSSNT